MTKKAVTKKIQHIKDLIFENPYIYALEGEPLLATTLITRTIPTTSDNPIRVCPYRYPLALEPYLEREIQKLLDQGIIKPSESNYASPTWIVNKKPDPNGEKRWRLVSDFRQLNEITLGWSSYPLPFTSDILEHLASANYIKAIDLKQGFYQITMDPADAHKTAFTAPSGCYQSQTAQTILKELIKTSQKFL